MVSCTQTHSLTHSPPHSPPHSLTHILTHILTPRARFPPPMHPRCHVLTYCNCCCCCCCHCCCTQAQHASPVCPPCVPRPVSDVPQLIVHKDAAELATARCACFPPHLPITSLGLSAASDLQAVRCVRAAVIVINTIRRNSSCAPPSNLNIILCAAAEFKIEYYAPRPKFIF